VRESHLVSAVIPTYNCADLVCDAVESALGQTWPQCEVIVVDDGSTDDTLSRLARFGNAISLVAQDHRGPAAARNAGIRASRGDLVAFLDADDIWLPEKVSRSVEALDRRPEAGVVFTAVRVCEVETGLRYVLPQYVRDGWMARDLFLECRGVNTSTLVVRRAALERVGLFDESLFRAQDWDLMLRLAEEYPYVRVPEVLTERRIHSRSLSATHAHLYKEYNLRVIEKALARRPELYGALRRRALSLAYLRFGLAHYREFRLREARREFVRALTWRWNMTALDYLLRTFLPAGLIRTMRRAKIARQAAASNLGES